MNNTRDWKKLETYCCGCGKWNVGRHQNCPVDEMGSLLWLDLKTFAVGCNKCNHTWALKDDTLCCSCGHVQKTPYRDATVVLEVGDQMIRSVGDLVYVLRRSGRVAVGRRHYMCSSYVP